uniref:MULE transposase domain-containing protein n=1 Tax=Lactuca sativa TaxID=4236 RepID=A0A9R1USP1_LACSA|nr:hypothetical protein LSAT_V11C800442960 [Lactuca sativa]
MLYSRLTKQQSITTIRPETYDMVFVPFTSIDNHKKCVTFAFLKAFRKQPQLVISDQDPALKKAIDNVFSLAHHRLCMWHITNSFQIRYA